MNKAVCLPQLNDNMIHCSPNKLEKKENIKSNSNNNIKYINQSNQEEHDNNKIEKDEDDEIFYDSNRISNEINYPPLHIDTDIIKTINNKLLYKNDLEPQISNDFSSISESDNQDDDLSCNFNIDDYYNDESENDSEINDNKQNKLFLKVLIIGNAKCGKTSIIRRYIDNTFNEKYHSTIGADYKCKDIEYDEHTNIILELWDIAGQDRFAKLTRGYFKDAKGAIIVCDVTRENTVTAVSNWKNEIDLCCNNINGCKPIPVVLIANKNDLLNSVESAMNIAVDLQKCVAKNNINEWFRASAKNGESIDKAFDCLVDGMMKIENEINNDQNDIIEKNLDANHHNTSSIYDKPVDSMVEGSFRLTSADPIHHQGKNKHYERCDCA